MYPSSNVTYMRKEVERGVAGQRADGECDEELEQVVVDDFARERNDGEAEETHERDERDCEQRADPRCSENDTIRLTSIVQGL